MKIERFPHKPYINEDFPKNVTAVLYSNVTFKCPIVSDLEPFMQWVRVADYPGDLEDTPKGELLQVHPLLDSVEVPGILSYLKIFVSIRTSGDYPGVGFPVSYHLSSSIQ